MNPNRDDPAHGFFRAIELEFIRLRVTPLLFSPDDFLVAKSWHLQGIPLDLVLETLREDVHRQLEKGLEVRRRLRHYQKSVLSVWKSQTEIGATGARDPAFERDSDPILEKLAQAVSGFPIAQSKIRSLKGQANIEVSLLKLEDELAAEAFEHASSSIRAQIDEEVEQALKILGNRLPAKKVAAAREKLRLQILRRVLELPTLSLSSLTGSEEL